MIRRIALVSLLGLAPFTFVGACSGKSTDGGDSSGNAGDGSGGTGESGGTSGSGRGGGSTGGTNPRGGSAGVAPSGGDAGTAPNGGSAGRPPTGGFAGAPMGGDAGTGPNGGSAGRPPTGGFAGAPMGGDAGTGPNGGSGGSAGGGSGGGGRECDSADDCVIIPDCCSCEAVPRGTSVPVCDRVCITDQCTAQQIGRDEVTCSFGRCVIDRSCNHNRSTCDSRPQACPAGQVRSLIEGGCWGPCLAPTECRDVTDCSACGGAVCVIEEPQIPTTGCVNPGASCTKGNYCECLDACPTSGFVCMEADDAVHCPCPVC